MRVDGTLDARALKVRSGYSGGQVAVVDATGLVTWQNVADVALQGPAGPAGQPGDPGPPGPAGMDGLEVITPVGFWRRAAGVGGSIATAANRAYFIPVLFPGGETYDLVGVNVTGVVAGSTAELGIYSPTADGKPGALLFDLGAVATSAVAQVTRPAPNGGAWTPAKGLYWLALLPLGGGPTVTGVATVNCARGDAQGSSGGMLLDGQNALPANAAGGFGWTTTVPLVAAHRSA